jgi:hypothetical protein
MVGKSRLTTNAWATILHQGKDESGIGIQRRQAEFVGFIEFVEFVEYREFTNETGDSWR